jgi:large subunit ribosomal protein L13
MQTIRYYRHSGYPNGKRVLSLEEMMEKKPEHALSVAVKRMLPKGKLGMHMFDKLKVHTKLPEHGYAAQNIQPLDL